MSDALLVIDLQNLWAETNPQTTKRIAEAADKLRSRMPIMWSYVEWLEPSEPIRAKRLEATKHFNIFAADFRADGYSPAIKRLRNDWILPKSSMSVFSNKLVAPFLKAQGVDQIFICGYMTGRCVRFSAWDGIDNGFKVVIPSDLTADARDESFEQPEKVFPKWGIRYEPLQSLGL